MLRSRDPAYHNLVQWSPCSAQLMVGCGMGQQITMYDILTEASTAIACPPAPTLPDRLWSIGLDLSPCGNLLLAPRLKDAAAAGRTLCLDVLSMPDASLVATFQLLRRGTGVGHHDLDCPANWVWHPSSEGLIIAQCNWGLVSAAPLHAAGHLLGFCPPPAHLTSLSAFSPSGRLLLTEADHGSEFVRQIAIFHCTQHNRTYTLRILHVFRSMATFMGRSISIALWCPQQTSEEVLLVDFGKDLRLASAYGQPLGSASPAGVHMCSYPHAPSFSPCGTLCSVSSEHAHQLHMLDCQSGVMYNMPGSDDEPAGHLQGRWIWPASGSCIVVQTLHGNGLQLQGGLCPFSLLHF